MVLLDKEGDWSPPFEQLKAARILADRLEELGTFPVQVDRLRECGLPWGLADRGRRILFCDQRFCPICRPRWRRQSMRKWWPKISEVQGVRGQVVAMTLTRPPHGINLVEQKQLVRQRVSGLFDRRQWKGSRGFIHQVGILLVVEIGSEGVHDGLVHLHVLVVSPEPEIALAAGEWMRDVWLEINPDASPLAQDVSLCVGPLGFDAWLNYILKGCILDPAWEDDRLEATVQVLIDGSHRLTSYGLLRTPRSRPRAKASRSAKQPTPVPNHFGHESSTSGEQLVSTANSEKTTSVDNISRVSFSGFGLDRMDAQLNQEDLHDHPSPQRRARQDRDHHPAPRPDAHDDLERIHRRGNRGARRRNAPDGE